MENPKVKEEIWLTLRQKWATLENITKVEFIVLRDPLDSSRELAIDVAQKINGDWVVQTVQQIAGEACKVLGIEDLNYDELVNLAPQVVSSVTVPITGEETYEEELHLMMKRISPETGEIYGHVISESGERVGIRSNYQHYFVINSILEKRAQMMNEEYSEVHIHRDIEDAGRLQFEFVPAR